MPVFMPDGNHFFYVSRSPGDTSSSGTYLAALDDPRARKVLSDDSSVVYSPPLAAGSSAHLLFMRDEVMMAQPFDEAKLEPVGDPFTVAPRVSRTPTGPQIAASVAQGTLVYLSGQDVRSQLAWFDLSSGKKVSSVGSTANQQGVALSFDGRNALIRRFEQNAPTSLWVYDLVGGRENRPMPPGTSFGSGATWFSDGSRILFGGASGTSAARGLYARDLNSSGQPELISPLEAVNQAVPAGFSRDGRFLVYTVIDPKTQADIWYVAWGVKPDLKNAVKFAATDAIESQGQLSPNGRCMAFTSNARGAFDVYIRPFPDGPGERKVSPDGGQQPRWSDDGKQLYFLRTLTTFDRATLFASSVGVEDGCVLAGPPRELFQFNTRQIVPQANVFCYSPHPDGKRVLVNSLIDEGEPTINLITNWHKAIPERETR
jgi:Tol biopolymer transport system component